jgi:hypothetical protein
MLEEWRLLIPETPSKPTPRLYIHSSFKVAAAESDNRLDPRADSRLDLVGMNVAPKSSVEYTQTVERKIFWTIFAFLGLIADVALPLWWAVGATVPIFVVSWWIAYRSEWF